MATAPQRIDAGEAPLASPRAGTPQVTPSLKGEWPNLWLLLALYTLQGIPIGLSSAVPMFLQSRGSSFSDQATFSLASWPYSLKLLWAPLVDGLWTTKFNLGQRKSWILPTQLLAGIIMLVLGSRLDSLFGGASPEAADNPSTSQSGGATPLPSANAIDIAGLTGSFFVLYFLVATQDIAVDGWGLTLLRPENVGWASTANTVGQTLGIMLAYGVLMALDSVDFSNNYVRSPLGLPLQPHGLMTMSQFMVLCGLVFIGFTTLLWLLKKEELMGTTTTMTAAAAAGAQVSAADSSLASRPHATHGSSVVESSLVPMTVSGDESGSNALTAITLDNTNKGRAGSHGQVRLRSSKSPSSVKGGGGRRPAQVGAAEDVELGGPSGTPTASSSLAQAQNKTKLSSQQRSDGESDKDGDDDDDDDESQALISGSASAASRATPTASASSGRGRAGTGSKDNKRRAGAAATRAPASVASASAAEGASAAPPAGTCQSAWDSVRAAYRDLGSVLRIRHVITLGLVMLTAKAGFTTTDSATSLVMQGRGLSKQQIAFQDVISTPIQLALQVAVSKWTAGPKPMSFFLKAFPLRVAAGLLWLAVIYGMMQTPAPGTPASSLPSPSTLTLVTIFLLSNAHSLVSSVMFLAQISFFTQVSDPLVGGSYMTLLNTMSNLGSKWPQFLTLRGIDWLTVKECIAPPSTTAAAGLSSSALKAISCANEAGKGECVAAGGVCAATKDGYFTMVLVGTVFSAVWYVLMRGKVKALEERPRQDWLLQQPQQQQQQQQAANSSTAAQPAQQRVAATEGTTRDSEEDDATDGEQSAGAGAMPTPTASAASRTRSLSRGTPSSRRAR